jgi:ElaB/YqjD/DUF883 family membrane-anchored ribosome-binding protein
MSFDTEPSVGALRAEAEATRSRLTGTVEELRTQVADTATDLKERLSPAAIKTEVKQYVRDSRDQLWHSIEQKARDNPLQAVAIGAALAYPALKLLRAMPAPLLLIGAGLLLSRGANGVGGAASEAAGTLGAHAQTAMDTANRTLDSAAETARSTISGAQDYAKQSVDSLVDRAASTATALKDKVTDVTNDATSAVRDVADKAKTQAETLVQQTRDTIAGTWDQNPLLVAGVGLAIGAFIAAAFPSTRAEDAVFGDASDALRRQAEGATAKGVEAAKTAVDGIAAAASDQGLSADGLNKLGETLTQKVEAVAARGVEAAFGRANGPSPGNKANS